jgi:hypothetical protein
VTRLPLQLLLKPLLLSVICPMFAGCAVHHDFDETAWRNLVLSQDERLLYAPHHNKNGYFNP